MHPNVSAACGVVLDSSQLKTKESGSILDGSLQRIISLTVSSPTMSGLKLGIQGKSSHIHQIIDAIIRFSRQKPLGSLAPAVASKFPALLD